MNHPSQPPLIVPIPAVLWGRQALRGQARPTISWLWHGLLARGNMTLLTSQWKSGKTTLVSVLLHRMKTGGTFAGRSLEAGRAVVISEESGDLWNRRAETLDFGDHVGWCCRPFRGRPRPPEWLALLDRLHELHAEHALDLVVVDTLATFLSTGSENEAGCIIEALTPLQRLANSGPAVLLLHHPRRRSSAPGQSARGSGSILGYCDILLEMRLFRRRDSDDRRRKLFGQARYPETPRHIVIELSADGTDYACLGTVADLETNEYWQVLRPRLESAPHKLTRRELLSGWPGGAPRNRFRFYDWLQDQVAAGVLRQDGTGVRESPFRYWLPEREAVWREDPLCFMTMPELLAESGPPAEKRAKRRKPAVADTSGVQDDGTPAKPAAIVEHVAPSGGPVLTARPTTAAMEQAAAPGDVASTAPASADPPPEVPVRLPYPWSIMNPADVPEEVWRQARAAQKKG